MSMIVVVTGATGFIASHCVKLLLEHGYRVRATVRNTDPERVSFLTDLDGAQERLELFQADLLDPGAFDTVCRGADAVLHVASPVTPPSRSNPKAALVDPAVDGTKNVCAAIEKSNSVKTLIFTSSIAAVFERPVPGHVFSENDWNTTSSVSHLPYYYAKTMAEKYVWEWQKTHGDVRVASMNPGAVVGPDLTRKHSNTLNRFLVDLFSGKGARLALAFAWVDVRDVAAAHVGAITQASVNSRYLLASEVVSINQIADWVMGEYPKLRNPANWTGGFATFMVRILSRLFGARDDGITLRQWLQVSLDLKVDTSRAEEAGMTMRPMKQSFIDAIADAIACSRLKVSD